MAAPTFAETWASLKLAVKPYTDLFAAGATTVSQIDSAEQDLEGDYLPATVLSAMATLRARLSATIDPSAMLDVWTAWLREVCRVAGYPETDLEGMAVRVHRYMHDNSQAFNDRAFIRGTPVAVGGAVGNGTLTRLTVDWEAYNLQHSHAETKRFECVVDQNLGVLSGQEIFECRGEDRSKDNLDFQGSGIRTRIYCMHSGSGNGGSLLQNSSFDSTFSGTGTDKIPGWTIGGTASKITADTTTYRTAPGASTSYALQFAADAAATNEVYQALSLRRIDAMGERVPWMLQVAYKLSAGATGTLTIKMGSVSEALDLSTVADTNWHVLAITADKDLYYRNWREGAPDVEVEVTNLSGATLNIDDLIFAPLTAIDGTWWWLVGGSTAFLQRDAFTVADTGGAAADGEMMWSAFRAGVPVSLPTNNAGGETIADP